MIEVRITQQFPQIGLQIQDAQYELKQERPDLEVKQAPAEVDWKITPPDLKIDYSPMLGSLGLGGIAFFARAGTDAAQAEYLANLERNTQIGDEIAAIENRASIGDIVFRAAQPREREIELAALSPIDITYTPGTAEPRVRLGGVEFHLNYGKVAIEKFTFSSVKIFLEKTPYVKISVVGQAFDTSK